MCGPVRGAVGGGGSLGGARRGGRRACGSSWGEWSGYPASRPAPGRARTAQARYRPVRSRAELAEEIDIVSQQPSVVCTPKKKRNTRARSRSIRDSDRTSAYMILESLQQASPNTVEDNEHVWEITLAKTIMMSISSSPQQFSGQHHEYPVPLRCGRGRSKQCGADGSRPQRAAGYATVLSVQVRGPGRRVATVLPKMPGGAILRGQVRRRRQGQHQCQGRAALSIRAVELHFLQTNGDKITAQKVERVSVVAMLPGGGERARCSRLAACIVRRWRRGWPLSRGAIPAHGGWARRGVERQGAGGGAPGRRTVSCGAGRGYPAPTRAINGQGTGR